MFEKFKARAEGVGAEVYRFKTRTEALDFILSFLKTEGVSDSDKSYAVWSDSGFLKGDEKQSASEKLPGLKFEINRELAAGSLAGICEMSYALADTGSLVADQTSIGNRLVSTLPAIHIAVIGTDMILEDKTAVFRKIRPETSNYIAFITGPSRTADIERVLTIGVHGPKRLVIVFVDEMKG
ncbi:MAG TPA: lactate utilization protein [Spirochaetota bacterium]|nr:lactate utilization protein [Spirochaetota bacterium]HPJ35003.1 lactate utilization protein [Spirochaetota bacterium]